MEGFSNLDKMIFILLVGGGFMAVVYLLQQLIRVMGDVKTDLAEVRAMLHARYRG